MRCWEERNRAGLRYAPAEGKDTEGLPPIQLYNLETDEGEKVNVCDAHPEIVAELRSVLTQYIVNGRSTPGAPQDNWPCENWPGLDWLKQTT